MEMGRKIITCGVVLVLLASVIVCNAQALNEDGLVAEWHFDEGSGSIVKDSSGNGNDGTIHGAKWVGGKYGKALEFDGRDDYVDVPDSASLSSIKQAVTVEAWINFKSSGVWQYLVSKHTGSAKTTPYQLAVNSANQFIFCIGDGTNYWNVYSTGFQPNYWLHVVSTFDGHYLRIYINGIEKNIAGIGTTVTLTINDVDLSIGQTTNGYYSPNGIIDEVRIYNRALTAHEIKSHYEGKQTELSIAKSVSPHSIKQGQTTTITLTVKNTGTTEIKDVEVADPIPADFIFISGETSKKYASLKPGESRDFQYILQSSESGTFDLGLATASYADEKGNYYTAKSNTAEIKVIPSLEPTPPSTTPTPTKTPSSASVNLYGEKTDVVLGEDILLRLSAVNLITKPPMTVQVIIIPPSGMSVTSAEFTKTIAGQYATTYKLEPGDGKDIEVRIKSNQVGDFVVEGRIVYYFGDDITTGEDHTLTLPIKVRPIEPTSKPTQGAEVPQKSGVPGFEAIFAITALLAVAYLVGRKKIRSPILFIFYAQ